VHSVAKRNLVDYTWWSGHFISPFV